MSLDADNIFKIQNAKHREMERYVLVGETSLGTDISDIYCRLCKFPVYAPYYRRGKVNYLHIACAHLPTEMEHELHPGCTLHLRTRGGEERVCNLCSSRDGCRALYFKCDCGEFVVDARCAFKLFPITYKFHHHPLIPIHKYYESFYCVACKRDHYGFSYECTTCTFRVHQDCVSARMVKLPSHHHDLKLIYSIPGNSSGEPIWCQICREDMKDANYAFHCARCRYFVHIYSCRSIEHPSHRHHPLVLIQEGDNDVFTSQDCDGCQQKTSVMYYTCSRKYYFPYEREFFDFHLHKFCAELPQTIEHHLHPEHALILKFCEYLSAEFMCNACHRPWKSFLYYCAHQSCSFTIDIACAMKTLYLKREFHEHKLLSTHKSPSFPCSACNRRSKGPTFECTICRFCVHQQCASVPMFKKYDLHPHKLKLTYLLQSSVKDDRKQVYCRICRGSIELHNWAYHCAGCRYYTHVHKCSDPFREIEGFDYEAALAASIRLPVVDEFVSFARLFLMDTNSKEEENEPQDEVGKKSRRMLFIEEDIETCHECAQFPAAPCNNCALCEYVLPRSPSELWGPSSSLLKGYNFLRDTTEHCNGFDMCSFGKISNMKINSTVLPRYVKHEGHSHVLSTTFVDVVTWCDACEKWFRGYGFRCNICQYTIDTYCALLPGSISHSYDKEHGFKLTYYSIEGVDEYVCEICEGDITTMWFYHCVKCDLSIHARCIWKHHVKFGPFVKIDNHKHELTVVPINKTTSFQCDVCHGKGTSGCRYCLSCEDCSLAVHLECIPGVENLERRALLEMQLRIQQLFNTALNYI